MTTTGFLSNDHPGRDPAFWREACEDGRRSGCETWSRLLDYFCQHRKDAASCHTLGRLVNEGRRVERNPLQAAKSLTRACDLGLREGCLSLAALMQADGRGTFRDACSEGDGESCFLLGELHHYGVGIARDDAAALDLFRRSCAAGWPRGCGRLGESYLSGQGTPPDFAKAIEGFEKACSGGLAGGCFTAARLYRSGNVVPRDEALAGRRLRRACELGLPEACEPGESPPPRPAIDPASELLKMGG